MLKYNSVIRPSLSSCIANIAEEQSGEYADLLDPFE